MENMPENKNRIIVESPSVKNRLVTYRYKVTGPWSEYFGTEEYSARYSFFTESIPFETLLVPFAGAVLPWAWLVGAEVQLEFCDLEFLSFAECLKKGFAQKHPGTFGDSSVICVHEHSNMRKDPEGALLIYEGEEDPEEVIKAVAQEKPAIASIRGTKIPLSDKVRTKEAAARAEAIAAKLGTQMVFCLASGNGIVDKDKVPEFAKMADADKRAFEELCGMLASVSLTAPQVHKLKAATLMIPGLSEELASILPAEQRVLSFTHAVACRESSAATAEEESADNINNEEKNSPLENEPCVSVVIPAYNEERYLKECLDSVLAQTYSNLEIICVDDGSVDKTPEILADYASADKRIRVIRQENSGLSVSRNRGIEAAQGKYLYFLDSDDYILPDHLEKLISVMERDDLDLCVFNLRPFISPDADSEQLKETYDRYEDYYKRARKYEGVCTGAELMKKMTAAGEYLVQACGYISKTEYVKKSGNLFLAGILHEDHLFTFCNFLGAERAAFCPDVYYQRRLAAGSIMTSAVTFRNVEGLFKCFLGMNRYMENMEADEEKEKIAASVATALLNTVRSRYSSLDSPEEKKKYEKLSPQEKMMFHALVVENRAVRVTYLERENAEYSSEILALKNETRAYAAENRGLAAQNTKLVDAGAKAVTANEKLRDENRKLRDEKSDLRSEKDRLKKWSEELDKNKKELEKKKTDLEAQYKELKEKRTGLETQKKELEKRKKDLETENKNLKHDLNDIRSGFLYRALHKIKLM